jgi:membrane protein required for colicin V production
VDFPLQPYDFLMLAVLALSTIFGAWKGMAWQLAALASLVVSAVVAVQCSGPVAPYFSVEEPWNRYIAMLVLYLATALAIWLLFRLVAGVIDRVRLREFDRQAGALFGAAKGVFWCVVITFFAVTLSESARQHILGTRSGYYTAQLIHRATPILPEEIRATLGKYIEELDRKLDPATPPEMETKTTTVKQQHDSGAVGGIYGKRACVKSLFSRRLQPPATGHKKHYRTLPTHV